MNYCDTLGSTGQPSPASVKAAPSVYKVLNTEREQLMAGCIHSAAAKAGSGHVVVAVVGEAHSAGIVDALEELSLQQSSGQAYTSAHGQL